MKDKIIKIAKDLEQGMITETEAQNLLLCLFGVSVMLQSTKEKLEVAALEEAIRFNKELKDKNPNSMQVDINSFTLGAIWVLEGN